MKLLFLNGSRGEWGYIQPVIDACKEQGIDYEICATNMVLLSAYGSLVNTMREQGYNVTSEIAMSLEGHTHATMAKSLAVFLGSFVDTLQRVKPTWLIVAGDRGEQLMGAVAAAYTYTPVAHIQAGELSGNIDGVARHAIGKFAHIHFAASTDAAERLRKLGEEDFRIHTVGHPALDPIVAGKRTKLEELTGKYGVSPAFMLVVMHPTTEDSELVADQAHALIAALDAFLEQRKVWVLPNNDAGSAQLRAVITKERRNDVFLFTNLPREDFLGFLEHASCIVGNSSAALLEAPTLGIPAVNIGRRQYGRLRGANVIDVPFEHGKILEAIQKSQIPEFRESIKREQNPYGDGHSSARILAILREIPINDRLLVKRLTY